jgi:tetratricopeptide (TPR) repeat protein
MKKLISTIRNKIDQKTRTKKHVDSLNNKIAIQATYNYGVSLFHLGQEWAYEHAIESFNKVLETIKLEDVAPLHDLQDLSQGSLACVYAKLAARNPKQKKTLSNLAFEEADKVFNNTTANNEAKALAYNARGWAHFSLGKYDQAIENFKISLNLNNSVFALLGIGEAYIKIGKMDEAMDAYQKASKMTTSGGYATYRLGNLFRARGDKDMAINAYERSSSLSVARLALGKIYLDDRDLPAALGEFRNATRINRRSSEAWVNIAWTILEMETTDGDLINECVNAARRALQIDIGSQNEWHRRTILAFSLILAKKPEQAFQEAKLGLDLSPDKAQTKFCVALCEFNLERKDNAKKILLSILRSDERGIWRERSENLIREIKEGRAKHV